MPRKITDLESYFFDHVSIPSDANGCWVWTGSLDRGYGKIERRIDGRKIYIRVTHLAWEIFNNEDIPDGLYACHKCDNPICVRPDHLFIGTHLDNMADAHEKGRLAHGENHYACRFSNADIEAMIEMENSGTDRKIIRERFRISQPYLSRLINGKRRSIRRQ